MRLVLQQIKDCERQIDVLFARMSPPPTNETSEASEEEGEPGQAGEQRDDIEILRSLDGVGRIVCAALLAEAAKPLRERDYHTLRAMCGVAPVTRRSGKRDTVIMRRACVPQLRNALYHWARTAVIHDPIWNERYQALCSRGHSAARAYRTIGDRLLNVAIKMLQTQTKY